MRIEIHIYGKNGVSFAVHKKRYHVVYVKGGIAVAQEFFGIIENFDSSKTEVENMKANGYFRIFDCGNLVFVKEYPENV